MKKFIIIFMMSLMAMSVNAQNYFSSIEITDEFGREKTVAVDGRINITDSTVVIKTAKNEVTTYVIVHEFEDDEEPYLLGSSYIKDTDEYGLTDKNLNTYVIAKRGIYISKYSNVPSKIFWILWKSNDEGEVVETRVYRR